jgi:PAS domain S-box-containing protein
MNLELHCVDLYQSYLKYTQKVLFDFTSEKLFVDSINQLKFPIASHTCSDLPIFNYANEAMLKLFGMQHHEFIGLPSNQSATRTHQEERERLLAEVKMNGFVENYQGYRVKKNGDTFLIKKATVWNVLNHLGELHSQAVIIFDWDDY